MTKFVTIHNFILPKTLKQSYSSIKENTTHFGFSEVLENQKQFLVNDVFSKVASKYDLMNDCMSLGVHRYWKDYFIRRLNPMPNSTLLDVAGGTGDITLRYLNYCKSLYNNDKSKAIVTDINPKMLEAGKTREEFIGFVKNSQVEFKTSNAEDLNNIESESVDAYTIAFGIRNCTNIEKVLKEAYRVLKYGGKFSCLEFSTVEAQSLKKIYDSYSFNVIPKIGRLVANDESSYRYLVESIRKFPNQIEFKNLIENAGFCVRTCEDDKGFENLSCGIACIHTGFKI